MRLKILPKGLVFGLAGIMFLAGLPLKTEAASAGALDSNFSGDGKVITNIAGNDSTRDVAIQPDGKIIVVGSAEPGAQGVNDFAVLRYQPDGSLDPTFDSDGIVTTNFGSSDSASAVAVQADGKIVVAGTSGIGGAGDFAVARYNPNGSLDPFFSGDGVTTMDFKNQNDFASSVLIQANGRILVGGSAEVAPGAYDCAFVSFTTSGLIDSTFSGDGIATLDAGGLDNHVNDMQLQADGKIVSVGTNGVDFELFRLTVSGFPDTTFDNDGIVTTNFSGADSAFSVQIQVDGKIIAAGHAGGTNSAIARYNPDGSLDNSFDGDGRVSVDLNPSFGESLPDIKLQGDGKILAAVSGLSGAFLGINVARFNANGSLDPSFGTAGRVTTSGAGGSIALYGSEVIVAGDGQDINVARFNLNIKPTQSNDFDGDGFSDYAIFRPSTRTWFILQSLTGATRITGFGANGDVPLDGDFDGDGLNDLAIYRPAAGEWWLQRSSDLTVFAAQFGSPGDKPVPGDIDKDGKSDLVFWRPANGNYFALRSSNNFGTFFGFPFGANGDIPVGTSIFP